MYGRKNNRHTTRVCSNNRIMGAMRDAPSNACIISMLWNATAISYIMNTHNENSYGNYLLGCAYEKI